MRKLVVLGDSLCIPSLDLELRVCWCRNSRDRCAGGENFDGSCTGCNLFRVRDCIFFDLGINFVLCTCFDGGVLQFELHVRVARNLYALLVISGCWASKLDTASDPSICCCRKGIRESGCRVVVGSCLEAGDSIFIGRMICLVSSPGESPCRECDGNVGAGSCPVLDFYVTGEFLANL